MFNKEIKKEIKNAEKKYWEEYAKISFSLKGKIEWQSPAFINELLHGEAHKKVSKEFADEIVDILKTKENIEKYVKKSKIFNRNIYGFNMLEKCIEQSDKFSEVYDNSDDDELNDDDIDKIIDDAFESDDSEQKNREASEQEKTDEIEIIESDEKVNETEPSVNNESTTTLPNFIYENIVKCRVTDQKELYDRILEIYGEPTEKNSDGNPYMIDYSNIKISIFSTNTGLTDFVEGKISSVRISIVDNIEAILNNMVFVKSEGSVTKTDDGITNIFSRNEKKRYGKYNIHISDNGTEISIYPEVSNQISRAFKSGDMRKNEKDKMIENVPCSCKY